MKYKINQRVQHSGHGPGTVVGYNTREKNSYLEGNLLSPHMAAAVEAGLFPAIVDSFYSGDRYPYKVKFDSGYEDVYSDDDLAPI